MPRGAIINYAGFGLAGAAVVAGALFALQYQRSHSDTARWAVIERYCVDCHNDVDLTGELSFESLTPADITAHAESFEAAIRKLRGDLMPPPGNPRPSAEEADLLIAWLENTLDAAQDLPRAGHVSVQRLDRSEFASTVLDLLAVSIDPAEYLPTEIEVDGFTNMAAALSVSPAFLEQYLSVARTVAHLAVGEAEPKLASAFFTAPPSQEDDQDGHTDGLPLGTRGGMRFRYHFAADGEYRFEIADFEIGTYQRSLETEHTLVMLIDRAEVFRGQIGGPEDLMLVNRGGATGKAEIMRRFADIPVQVAAGDHEVAVTFIERSQAATDTHIRGFVNYGGFSFTGEVRAPRLTDGVRVTGPFNSTGMSRTASRDMLFICTPEVPEREVECARRIAANLAERAFRRPVTDDDVDTLMRYFAAGRTAGGTFDKGIEHVVAAVLASPDFLYRTIAPAESSSEHDEYPLTGSELATRLSYFLWGQGPDSELRELAAAGDLGRSDVLAAEALRMLGDARADKLVTEFALRWLDLSDLTVVNPDSSLFPNFSETLRSDFATEIELFIASILREDRDVRELLTADHTFVNDRLAAHYGIEGVYGPQFRRVTLTDPARHGLLGKAAVLLRTSYSDRTSPVLRGAWVLARLMGTPPTPPPPGVETNLSTPEGEQPKTIRVRLEQHRVNSSCNGCHGVIDPYGIALENFTVLGEWRDRDREADAPIDASTVLPSGVPADGPVALTEALLARPDQFVQALTEKLLMYALGRELEYHDMRQVRRIVRDAEKQNYSLAAIVTGIVTSDAFRMQAAQGEG
jgi:hypothetical protein